MATAAIYSIPDDALRGSRTTLYDSSDPGGLVGGGMPSPPLSRTGRGRSVSVSSSVSQSQSSSASSCSLSSLDSDEIKNIFSTYQNVTVSGNKIQYPSPSSPNAKREMHPLVFGARPWKQRALATAEATAAAGTDDQPYLNPKAAPFVPGGAPVLSQAPVHEITYYDDEDSEDDMGVVYYPGAGPHQQVHRPPGLLITSGQRTPTNTALQTSTSVPYEQHRRTEQPPVPRWTPFFVAGTSLEAAYDPMMFDLNANAVVTSLSQWTDEDLMFFASQFPSKAYSSVEGCEYPVAMFAFAAYSAFATMHGDVAAQAFLWSLRQHSLYAFTTSWSSESLDPSVHAGSGLTGHVLSSIFLARFIGDLFNQGLLAKEHITSCISKLLENPISEEHVAALGHLVSQAGPELWMSEPMQLDMNEFEEFMGKLGRAVASVRMTLVENNTQPRGYCRVWLDKVRVLFESWRIAYSEDPAEYSP